MPGDLQQGRLMIKSLLMSFLPINDQNGDVHAVVTAMKDADPEFARCIDRALWIIKADQEVFARYTTSAECLDDDQALQRLVCESACHGRKPLAERLQLQVAEVLEQGRVYPDRKAVENARNAYALTIGISI